LFQGTHVLAQLRQTGDHGLGFDRDLVRYGGRTGDDLVTSQAAVHAGARCDDGSVADFEVIGQSSPRPRW
jgi:hypothetical protein